MTIGVIGDIHWGPQARFGGKLRKLSQQAETLVGRFAERMRREVRPDLIVNLGDVVEDESPELDLARYRACLALLGDGGSTLVNVAGNHDCVHLEPAALRRSWGLPPAGPLYYSFDRGGLHFVVLYSHERRDRDVRLGAKQLAWLEADLLANDKDAVVLVHHAAADQDLAGNHWFDGSPRLCLIADRRRLRALLERGGRTRLVINGHLHWTHFDVVRGIPYLTLQSLTENVEEDAPGRPAAAHAVVRISPGRIAIDVSGAEPARYQIDR